MLSMKSMLSPGTRFIVRCTVLKLTIRFSLTHQHCLRDAYGPYVLALSALSPHVLFVTTAHAPQFEVAPVLAQLAQYPVRTIKIYWRG
jgi:hypothetical protein